MTRTKFKVITIACSVFVAITIGASTIPTCQRFVTTYKQVLVKNTVSKVTQARWNLWNKSHPNFKPKPRPKYKMTTEEVVQLMDAVCPVTTDLIPKSFDLVPTVFEPNSIDLDTSVDTSTDLIPLVGMDDYSLPSYSGVDLPTSDSIGYIPSIPFYGSSGYVGLIPSGTIPISGITGTTTVIPVAPVPEPSSFVLILIALSVWFCLEGIHATLRIYHRY